MEKTELSHLDYLFGVWKIASVPTENECYVALNAHFGVIFFSPSFFLPFLSFLSTLIGFRWLNFTKNRSTAFQKYQMVKLMPLKTQGSTLKIWSRGSYATWQIKEKLYMSDIVTIL